MYVERKKERDCERVKKKIERESEREDEWVCVCARETRMLLFIDTCINIGSVPHMHTWTNTEKDFHMHLCCICIQT